MGLDQYLVTDGARIPVGVIDRGFSLIYGGKEWRDRYTLFLLKSYIIRVTPFLVPLLILAIGASTSDPFLFAPFTFLLIVTAPFMIYYTYDAVRSYNVINSGAAPPGVYAMGVEMPMAPVYSRRYFIPWGEIEAVEVVRAGFLLTEVVNLRLNNSRLTWSFPLTLLGRSELVKLKALLEEERRSRMVIGNRAPPRMVVYGTGGLDGPDHGYRL